MLATLRFHPGRQRLGAALALARRWWKGAAGLLVGLLVGWWWCTPQQIPEPPAPAFRQPDGSLVLERIATPQRPSAQPHAIPRGGKEERRVSVVVKPPRGAVPSDPATPVSVDSCDCPPVQVDLSLVRMPDQTRRVVASSPTGTILSGLDIPIEPVTIPRVPWWAASIVAMADRDGIRPGALVSRRFGSVVVGAGVLTDPGMRRPGAIGQFGVTW